MTLVLSKAGDTPDAIEGVIDSFRELIGPKDVNTAKEEAPERYVQQMIVNILCWKCLILQAYLPS
jgi:hypothetical protein